MANLVTAASLFPALRLGYDSCWNLFYKTSDEINEEEETKEARSKHEGLLKKEGIRNDFSISSQPMVHPGMVYGSNFTSFGDAKIGMWAGLKKRILRLMNSVY